MSAHNTKQLLKRPDQKERKENTPTQTFNLSTVIQSSAGLFIIFLSNGKAEYHSRTSEILLRVKFQSNIVLYKFSMVLEKSLSRQYNETKRHGS